MSLRLRPLAGILTLLAIGIIGATTAAAAPAQRSTIHATPSAAASPAGCVAHRQMDNWNNPAQLEAHGFHRDLFSDQASMSFDGDFLSLDVAADPNRSTYAASRITEIESAQPIDARVKCWQPTADKDVVVTFTVRFDQATVQPGMTENLFLWNAPLPPPGVTGDIRPFTVAGVSRSNGAYTAVVAEDLDLATFSGLIQQVPMPDWLNAADWHQVRTTVSQSHARIEVAQGTHAYTSILDVALPHTPEPMGFEFSVDNEAFPGFFVPVAVPDGLDIDTVDIRLAHVNKNGGHDD